MNVNFLITMNYENWTLGHIGKTNPIQTQLVLRSLRRSRIYRVVAYGEDGSNPALHVLSLVEGSSVEWANLW
jgi:hypothetical protein